MPPVYQLLLLCYITTITSAGLLGSVEPVDLGDLSNNIGGLKDKYQVVYYGIYHQLIVEGKNRGTHFTLTSLDKLQKQVIAGMKYVVQYTAQECHLVANSDPNR